MSDYNKDKSMKNVIIGLSVLAFLVIISIILAVRGNTKSVITENNHTIASFYIPDKDKMYLESGPLSVLTNRLLYPSMAEITKDGLKPLLAKSYLINGNDIEVVFENNNDAKTVYDSIYKLGHEVYENSFLLNNISGFTDYTLGSDTISGMTLNKNSIFFKVSNSDDLSFLTVPTIDYESNFKITTYNKNSFTISDGNETYNFILVNKDDIKDTNFDILLTSDTTFTVENMQNYLLDMYNDYIILNNFTDKEKEEFSGIFNGKRAKFDFTLYFWSDSSYKGALLTEKIKSNVNTDVFVDYGYREFFLKELDTDNKFAVYYENDALDLNELSQLEKIDFIKVPSKQINVIFKNDIL